MTDIIEAGARALAGDPSDKLWNAYHAGVQQKYTEDAHAAYVAMVGAMTDEEIYEIVPLWNPYNATAYVSDDYCQAQHIERKRAALLKLVEVDDD